MKSNRKSSERAAEDMGLFPPLHIVFSYVFL